MTVKESTPFSKKFGYSLLGGSVLVVGITLILTQWDFVVSFFRGVVGMALALTGLLILLMIKD